MGKYLDLDDVCFGHPEAEKEKTELYKEVIKLRKILAEWKKFSDDIVPDCAAGEDELRMIRLATDKALADKEK